MHIDLGGSGAGRWNNLQIYKCSCDLWLVSNKSKILSQGKKKKEKKKWE